MPLTRYGFAAIDLMPDKRADIARDLAKYIETDLDAQSLLRHAALHQVRHVGCL